MYNDTKTKRDRLGESPARFDIVDCIMIIIVSLIIAGGLWGIVTRMGNVDVMMGVW